MSAALEALARRRQATAACPVVPAHLQVRRRSLDLRQSLTWNSAAVVATAAPALRRVGFSSSSLAGLDRTARMIRLAGRIVLIARLAGSSFPLPAGNGYPHRKAPSFERLRGRAEGGLCVLPHRRPNLRRASILYRLLSTTQGSCHECSERFEHPSGGCLLRRGKIWPIQPSPAAVPCMPDSRRAGVSCFASLGAVRLPGYRRVVRDPGQFHGDQHRIERHHRRPWRLSRSRDHRFSAGYHHRHQVFRRRRCIRSPDRCDHRI